MYINTMLFRGKTLDKKHWVYGNLFKFNNEKCIIETSLPTYDKFLHDVIPKSVGQYTGVEDLYGERVFEGDIVFLSDGKAGTVKFYNDRFVIDINEPVYRNLKELETIEGNIFDNPLEYN